MQKSSFQTGIWLIGIGILALTNYWWPGIMFVIGMSVLVSGSVRAAIWVFGIGVIAMFDFWWPGILFLIGLGFIVGGIFPDREEESAEEVEDSVPSPQEFPNSTSPEFSDTAPQPPASPSPQPVNSRTWLPARCPACGAPLTPAEALWIDDTHAECSYCHTPINR